MKYNNGNIFVRAVLLCAALTFVVSGCAEYGSGDDPADPKGPGQLVGHEGAVSNPDTWRGGSDPYPEARPVATMPDDSVPPNCGAECLAYCDSLGMENPVNQGVCPYLWGVGLQPRPVVIHEACRRLFVDMLGRFPTREEVASTCEGRPWGDVVKTLLDTDEFVFVNQRRWADKLMYNNQTVSVTRIFDMDDLVGKLYSGEVAYDEFATVVSAHPVLTRQHDTAEDRAEALFWLFLSRPPLGNERSDMGRLYNQWTNFYYDHPQLGARLPDAYINFACTTEDGRVDDGAKGECTSIIWGYNELIMTPDVRATLDEDENKVMWSGVLRPDEWQKLQEPGRIVTAQPEFWETIVDDAIEMYFGYRLGVFVPPVRDQLVRYLVETNGDIRALHYAIATSFPYLQSSQGATQTNYRWTYGPLKQVDVEPWIDSINRTVGNEMSYCDHRIPRPGDLMDTQSVASVSMVENSYWDLDAEGEVRNDYAGLARSIGGCPSNDTGSRFKTISILTTATQLSFVANVCGSAGDGGGVPAVNLMPPGMDRARALDTETARQILEYQTGMFFSRDPSPLEYQIAVDGGVELTVTEEERDGMDIQTYMRDLRSAEDYARNSCWALLSSAEMLFY